MKTYKVVMLSGDTVTVEADVLNVDERNNLRFGVAEDAKHSHTLQLKIIRVFAAGQWLHVKVEGSL